MFNHVLLAVMFLGCVYGIASFAYEFIQKKEKRDILQLSLSFVISLTCIISIYVWI